MNQTEKMLAVNFERTPIFEFGNQSFIPVDLGLPSGRKWANRNVGAKSEDDCGYMMDFDTANAIEFQDGWHVPSPEDFKELVANCESEWTLQNGVPGRVFKSKINGNSIFLPAAGWSWFDKKDELDYGTTLSRRGTGGYYWSSGFNSASLAYSLNFNSSEVDPQDYDNRGYGFTVRAVQ